MPVYCVYCHVFPNNKIYVGITCQPTHRRWGRKGQGYKKQPILYAAIEKYGWDNIQHNVVCNNLDYIKAKTLEKILIAYFDCMLHHNGYNGTEGGECKGIISEETKQRMSASQKGRILTQEHRIKLSQVKLGSKQTSETIQRRVNSRKQNGWVVTEETKLKSAITQGKPIGQYTKDGQLIATYISANAAFRQTNIQHIGDCCNGKLQTAGGFVWHWLQEVM